MYMYIPFLSWYVIGKTVCYCHFFYFYPRLCGRVCCIMSTISMSGWMADALMKPLEMTLSTDCPGLTTGTRTTISTSGSCTCFMTFGFTEVLCQLQVRKISVIYVLAKIVVYYCFFFTIHVLQFQTLDCWKQ